MIDLILAAAEAGLQGQDQTLALAYGLFIVGMCLVIVEIFLPGVILGLLGVVGVIVSIVLAFKVSRSAGTVLFIIAIVSLPAFLVAWIKVIGPALAHHTEVKDDENALQSLHSLVGQEGIAMTRLRPAGMARLGERRVDVVTDGELIEANTRIKAVEVRGNQVVVRPIRL